jgi:ABC-type phosphate transport system substrate-binding protein
LSFIVQNEATSTKLRIASFLNSGNIVVEANPASLGYALLEKGAELDSHLTTILANAMNPLAWPIVGFTYFSLHITNHTNRTCQQTTEVGKFLSWFYTAPVMASIVADMGLVHLPYVMTSVVLSHLRKHLTCNDGTLAISGKATVVCGRGVATLSSTINLLSTAFKHMSPQSGLYDDVKFAYDRSLVSNEVASLSTSSQPCSNSSLPASVPVAYDMYPTGPAVDRPRAPQPGRLQLPVFAVGVVPVYHCSSCVGSQSLSFDLPLLTAIFSGQVTFWDNSALVALNPNVTLPHQPIRVIVHARGGPTTNTFIKAVFSPSGMSNFTLGAQIELNDAAVQRAVLFNDFSISYVSVSPYPYRGISVAHLRTSPAASPLSFSPDALMSCFDPIATAGISYFDAPALLLQKVVSSFASSSNQSCWPMRYLVNVEIPESYMGAGCLVGRPTTLYWGWMYTDTTLPSLRSHGLSTLPSIARAAATRRVSLITCDGNPIRPTCECPVLVCVLLELTRSII